jgi:hypothetical protein
VSVWAVDGSIQDESPSHLRCLHSVLRYLHHRRGHRSLQSTATAVVDDKTGECVSLFVHTDDVRPTEVQAPP